MRFWELSAYDIEVASLQKFCQYVMQNSMKSINYEDELKSVYRDYSKAPVKVNIDEKNVMFVSNYKQYGKEFVWDQHIDERKNVIAVRLSPRKWILTNYLDWSFIPYKDYMGNDYISLRKVRNTHEMVLFIERFKKPIEETLFVDNYSPKVISHDYDDESYNYFSSYLYNSP